MTATTGARRHRLPVIVLAVMTVVPSLAWSQIDEGKTGAWYMYLWNVAGEPDRMSFQGDIQHRNWDGGGDLEQLLIRAGVTLPANGRRARYTFGGAHIISGPFGTSNAKSREDRIYQEAVIPGQIGERLFLTHRFRSEQRWVDGQSFRMRMRYFFGLNYPLNKKTLEPGALYLSLYNELFINLNRSIGDGRRVDHFDRNRLYLALGYSLRDNLRVQFGYMHQQTNTIGKGQLQLSFVHAM